jgi:protein lifeguard
VPYNYSCLFIFTLSLSYVVSAICGFYSSKVVLEAAILTLAVTVILTLYAIYSTDEISVMYGILISLIGTSFVLLILYFIFGGTLLYTVYTGITAAIFGIYLVIDIKLLIRKVTIDGENSSYTYDDYCLAACQIYVDIVNIFLELL